MYHRPLSSRIWIMKSEYGCFSTSPFLLFLTRRNLQDNDSHFHEALDHWRQLNLAPSFIKFAGKADGLSASMPLLLHNWRDIYTLWEEALKSADDEGLRALLEYVPHLLPLDSLLNFFFQLTPKDGP
jgi:hypothetical protein